MLVPDLGNLSTQAFDQTLKSMAVGESAARESLNDLLKYSISEATYAAHRLAKQIQRTNDMMIDNILVDNESRLSTSIIEAQLTIGHGEVLNAEQLEADIAVINGLDVFESVDYSIKNEGEETTLVVRSKGKEWGPNYLRFGVNLEDDFSGTSNYNLATRLTMTELNERGGEIRADVIMGDSPQLSLELYQPIDRQLSWFVSPRIGYQNTSSGLFVEQEQIALFRSQDYGVSMEFGRNLGKCQSRNCSKLSVNCGV